MSANGTAGTAGANFRAEPPPHDWTPVPRDVHERSRCKHCDQPRHQHEETRTR